MLSEICFGAEVLHGIAHILNTYRKRGIKRLSVSRATYPAHITGPVVLPAHWSVAWLSYAASIRLKVKVCLDIALNGYKDTL